MFVKQPNRRLQQLLAVENKTILQQPKPSTFYIIFHLTLFFIHITLACVHKCLTLTGHLKSAALNTQLKQRWTHSWSTHLLSKKIFMLKQKSSNLYRIGFNSSKKISEWLFIHITLETAPNEMQCDETNSHVVTAGRSYFRTLRNACVTAGKTTMTAGKIYHGCFEMLSWPHRTSANIINTCFWLLETWTKCSYFIEENIQPGAQRLAFEVKYEYIVRQPRIYRGAAFCSWASFQTSGDWSVPLILKTKYDILFCVTVYEIAN